MTARTRQPQANPMLGIYFGIFITSLIAVVLLLLIFEQLGVAESHLRFALMAGSCCLFMAIGAAGFTSEPAQFFLAFRRIPAFFAGLGLAITAIGGSGLVVFSGTIFLAGFDALCVPMGIVAGLVAMAILIAPYLRKFGAPSIPAYLGLRFDSPAVRLAAASAAAAPLILLIIAEMKIALLAMSWLVDWPPGVPVLVLTFTLAVTLIPGGVRSLSWSSAAQALTALLAVLIPATIVAVIATNLPLGQMSHGPVLRALGRTELAQGLPISIATAMTFDLPRQALQPIAGRFANPFSSVGSTAFVLMMLCIMAGIAASPAALGRAVVTQSVYEARKSIGWAVFIVGVIIMTLSANAVFFRDILMNQLAGAAPGQLPAGFQSLVEHGLAAVDPKAVKLTASSFAFRRDGTLLGLPILLGFPLALILLIAAGVLAAALAAASASLAQLAVIASEDVIAGLPGEPIPAQHRLLATRAAIAVLATLCGWAAAIAIRDPLDLVLWSLALSGSTFFPVLVLSIWWKRITALGALAGIGTGFAVALVALIAGVFDLTRFPEELSSIFGIPCGFAAAIGVSLITPVPGRHILEMVRDLRVPGGETLHDREIRLLRQKRSQNS